MKTSRKDLDTYQQIVDDSQENKNTSKRIREETIIHLPKRYKQSNFYVPGQILQEIVNLLPLKEIVKIFRLNKSFHSSTKSILLDCSEVALNYDIFFKYFGHREKFILKGLNLLLGEISHLEFLKPYLVNLRRVIISCSYISFVNLEALKVCSRLKDIHLNGFFDTLLPLANCPLTKITFFNVSVKDNFTSLIQCEQLTEVCMDCISDSTALLEVVSHLPLLEKLTIKGSNILRSIPSLSECIVLREIHINMCTKIDNITGIYGLKSLKNFYFHCSDWNIDFSVLGTCINLESITIINSLYKINLDIDFLKTLPKIRKLKLDGYNLIDTHSLKGCLSLEELHLERMAMKELILPDIGLVNIYGQLSGLKSIKIISSCPEINSNYSTIEELFIGWDRVPLFEITNWINLISVTIVDTLLCENFFGQHLKLKKLTLDGVRHLSFLNNEYPLLEELSIKGSGVVALEGLEKYSSLTKLSLAESFLRVFPGIETLPNLTYLSLIFSPHFEDFSTISGCTKLESLVLSNIYMGNLSFLEPLRDLKSLSLISCHSLEDLEFLNYCRNLEELTLKGIYNRSFNCFPLLAIPSLRYFHVASASSIIDYDKFVKLLPYNLVLVLGD
jgi:hypothetical protein